MEPLVLSEKRGRVGWVTLNRPKALNALNDALIDQLVAALQGFDSEKGVGAIVITGSDKAFAAGADIAAMKDWSFVDAYKDDYITRNWDALRRVRKPMIAAVAGYALAADSARFGQPEIKLGIIPGAGGTQRLPRAVGKAKAMDLVLTGRNMDAQEAERCGLVARVVPAERLHEEVLEMATTIAAYSLPAVLAAKEAINRAYESPLADGAMFERRLFHALFATADQKEGMAAFLEKRPPRFGHS